MRYHVLKRSPDTTQANIVFHLDIPAGTNAAGISYVNLFLRIRGGGSTVRHHALDFATEAGELATGTKFEYRVNGFTFTPNANGNALSDIQRRAQLRAKYLALVAELADDTSALYDEIITPLEWYLYGEERTDGSWDGPHDYPDDGAIPTPAP